MTTKKKAKPVPSTVMVGGKLKKRPIPNQSAILAARFRREMEFHEAQRKEKAQQVEAERQRKDADHAQKCRDVVMLRAGAVGLAPLDVQRLANVIETQRREHIAGSIAFDVYKAIQDALATRFGKGVAVHSGANPLDAQRPLPQPRARHQPPPTTEAEQARANQADRSRAAAVDKAKRDHEQRIQERQAYVDSLKRLGLTPPELGSHFSGLGLTGRG